MCFLMFSEKRFIHFAPFEVFAQHLIYTSFSNQLQCVSHGHGQGWTFRKIFTLSYPWITLRSVRSDLEIVPCFNLSLFPFPRLLWPQMHTSCRPAQWVQPIIGRTWIKSKYRAVTEPSRSFKITGKTPPRAFSWLEAPTSTTSILRHY